MPDDLIRRVAEQTAALPNTAAWARIEVLLALAGVPRRQWSKLRAAAWAERQRQKAEKKCHAMTDSDV